MKATPALAIALSAAVLTAQDGPQFRVESRLVAVYANVRNHKGEPLQGLSKDQFEVRDNGKMQPILFFESDEASFSCAILLDTTGSMKDALPAVKRSIIEVLGGFREDDAVAIYSFSTRIQRLQNFTTDKRTAVSTLMRMRAAGSTAIFDALVQLIREIEPRSGKKAIIVFTDGEDNSSLLSGQIAVRRANSAGIPIYSIAQGVALGRTVTFQQLKDISMRTGGRAFQPHSGAEMATAFEQISIDLRHTYMLAYRPPENADQSWHSIELIVPGIRAAKILARQGYFSR
jgi:Ca-activated chloride channel family protein